MSVHEVSYIKCDRCGIREEGEDSPDDWAALIECWIPGVANVSLHQGSSIDLCSACTKVFINWMTADGNLRNAFSISRSKRS